MDAINPHACREGFEQQRKAGINVDWFTWQIAWHDAMFTQVDCAKQSASTNRLTDEKLDAAILEWFSYERDQDDFRARMRAAIIAATEAK